MDALRLADLGEAGLLARLFAFCDRTLVGDDAAVLTGLAGRSPVVTTDVLVDGVHFSDRTTPPHAIGWRAIAANLSDLAAMGAEPIAVTVGLSLPGTVAIDWVEALYGGMADCLGKFGGVIVGGDVTRSPVAVVAITAIGAVAADDSDHFQIIRRDTAQAGDAIVVTGAHGASRAGLAWLLADWPTPDAPPREISDWIAAHQYPQPRFDAIAQLDRLRARDDRPIAGMDSSDGLADAVVQLARSSGLAARLDRLPIPAGLVAAVGLERAIDWTLYGGEDFELVLCLPPELADRLVRSLGGAAALIGQMIDRADSGTIVTWQSAPGRWSALTQAQGFQHFAVESTTAPP
ncbi:MAG: thiamine-phosphate kinase [Oscillatoriales cyanobacterium]|nr:MAG: thiamine-phosphate kinase [Oscillatoriales cyanobacterium]